jgi:hypothetical protein
VAENALVHHPEVVVQEALPDEQREEPGIAHGMTSTER